MNSMTEKYEQVRLLKKDLKTLQLIVGLPITDIKTGEKIIRSRFNFAAVA